MPDIDLISGFQIALKNNIDYPTVLGQLREARKLGLTAPVLLMGKTLFRHDPPPANGHHQVITTLCWRTGKTKQFKMQLKLVLMVSLWLICLPKRPSPFARNA